MVIGTMANNENYSDIGLVEQIKNRTDQTLQDQNASCCPQPFEFPNTLLSERVLAESSRKGLSVPPVDGQLQIYDNGAAQVYRCRPLTPYQR
jgi:hypothetical protein